VGGAVQTENQLRTLQEKDQAKNGSTRVLRHADRLWKVIMKGKWVTRGWPGRQNGKLRIANSEGTTVQKTFGGKSLAGSPNVRRTIGGKSVREAGSRKRGRKRDRLDRKGMWLPDQRRCGQMNRLNINALQEECRQNKKKNAGRRPDEKRGPFPGRGWTRARGL